MFKKKNFCVMQQRAITFITRCQLIKLIYTITVAYIIIKDCMENKIQNVYNNKTKLFLPID